MDEEIPKDKFQKPNLKCYLQFTVYILHFHSANLSFILTNVRSDFFCNIHLLQLRSYKGASSSWCGKLLSFPLSM